MKLSIFVLSTLTLGADSRLGRTVTTSKNMNRKIVSLSPTKRTLQDLEGFGSDPNDKYLPLLACQGDCDTDEDVSGLCREKLKE